jgi:hypothetical protein
MSEAANREKNASEVDASSLQEEERLHDEHTPQRQSLGSTFRQFFNGGRTPVAKRDLKQDRTQPLMLLIGGIVGSVLLFLGVFSTPPTRQSPVERDRAQSNLGRADSAGPTKSASVTPLLNAELHSDDIGRDRLSAADIKNTSQRDAAVYDRDPELATQQVSEDPRDLSAPSDPLIAYRRNNTSGPLTYTYGAPAVNTAVTRTSPDLPYSGTLSFGGSNSQGALPAITAASTKSSIVFVRSAGATSGPANASPVGVPGFDRPTLLAPGSRLIARLESAVTSALKAPVVAAIEYNYERDGVILIPAGTKAIGELQQASINGYVGITFHTLQMPDGRNEQIEAMAMDLRNEPLKGNVTGTNKGRKFMTRTLSGVGTIAAYVVGAGGSGLGRTITGETLLRDRLAGNIASAGEQELTNAAFSQNIVVTVPAQTRLYIVFRKGAVERVEASPVTNSVRGAGPEIPSAQELRELMDLRREINRMYETSAATPNPAKP